MFTTITPYYGIQELHGEYIWEAGESAAAGWLAGAMLGSEIIRVRFIRPPHFDKTRYRLANGGAGTLPYHSWIVNRGDEQWPATSSQESAEAILASYLQGFAFSDTEIRLTRLLANEERVYGLGERTGDMNKRGQTFPIWNVDPPLRHNASTLTMYASIPFYIGLQRDTGRAYGVLRWISGIPARPRPLRLSKETVWWPISSLALRLLMCCGNTRI